VSLRRETPGGGVAQPLVGLAFVTAIAAILLAAGGLLAQPSMGPVVVAASFVVLVVGASAVAPRYVLYLLVVWLAVLGLLRRIFDQYVSSGEIDPLLVVVPATVIALLIPAAAGGAFRNLTTLAKAVLVLSALALLGALNPVQGNLTAGFIGLLFVLAPTLAFWVGRGVLSDAVAGVVFKLLAVLAIAVAAYGLEQTFGEFRPWDQAWIERDGYESLNVGGTIRAFGTFASAHEYALFLSIGIAIWLAYTLRSLRIPLGLAAIGLLGTALVYASARGTIFTLVVALGLMAAARLRVSFPIAALLGAVVVVLITVGAGLTPASVRSTQAADGGTAELLAHQLDGLARPFDRDSSTLGLHYELVEQGISQSYHAPLGIGISAVSIAGAKFGDVALLTEADPSNMAVALGLPGFATYLVILVLAFRAAYGLARRRGDALALIALGILAISVFQWLNGGLYAVSTLTWLVLGWVDRSWAKVRSDKHDA
jgi:hypothetical protein